MKRWRKNSLFTQFLLAFQFLTILPIRISGTVRDKDLAGSMCYYPLVGAALGVLGAGLYEGALRLFSPAVAIVSAVVGLILFSGALHVDGFADMCDGFYGHRDRDQILAIMKDSHIGAMAAIGVVCLLALKIAFLGSLDVHRAMWGLILAPTLGRWSMVLLCATSTYARPKGGAASAYIGQLNDWTMGIATLLCTAIAYLLFRFRGLGVMVVAAGFTWAFRRYTERRIGGMTGDTLGACNELVEVLVLAVLSVHRTALGL
jgi:adenosylcobinamide-GDP ribazoletransferase